MCVIIYIVLNNNINKLRLKFVYKTNNKDIGNDNKPKPKIVFLSLYVICSLHDIQDIKSISCL